MIATQRAQLGALAPLVEKRLAALDATQVARRIWQSDPTALKGRSAELPISHVTAGAGRG